MTAVGEHHELKAPRRVKGRLALMTGLAGGAGGGARTGEEGRRGPPPVGTAQATSSRLKRSSSLSKAVAALGKRERGSTTNVVPGPSIASLPTAPMATAPAMTRLKEKTMSRSTSEPSIAPTSSQAIAPSSHAIPSYLLAARNAAQAQAPASAMTNGRPTRRKEDAIRRLDGLPARSGPGGRSSRTSPASTATSDQASSVSPTEQRRPGRALAHESTASSSTASSRLKAKAAQATLAESSESRKPESRRILPHLSTPGEASTSARGSQVDMIKARTRPAPAHTSPRAPVSDTATRSHHAVTGKDASTVDSAGPVPPVPPLPYHYGTPTAAQVDELYSTSSLPRPRQTSRLKPASVALPAPSATPTRIPLPRAPDPDESKLDIETVADSAGSRQPSPGIIMPGAYGAKPILVDDEQRSRPVSAGNVGGSASSTSRTGFRPTAKKSAIPFSDGQRVKSGIAESAPIPMEKPGQDSTPSTASLPPRPATPEPVEPSTQNSQPSVVNDEETTATPQRPSTTASVKSTKSFKARRKSITQALFSFGKKDGSYDDLYTASTTTPHSDLSPRSDDGERKRQEAIEVKRSPSAASRFFASLKRSRRSSANVGRSKSPTSPESPREDSSIPAVPDLPDLYSPTRQRMQKEMAARKPELQAVGVRPRGNTISGPELDSLEPASPLSAPRRRNPFESQSQDHDSSQGSHQLARTEEDEAIEFQNAIEPSFPTLISEPKQETPAQTNHRPLPPTPRAAQIGHTKTVSVDSSYYDQSSVLKDFPSTLLPDAKVSRYVEEEEESMKLPSPLESAAAATRDLAQDRVTFGNGSVASPLGTNQSLQHSRATSQSNGSSHEPVSVTSRPPLSIAIKRKSDERSAAAPEITTSRPLYRPIPISTSSQSLTGSGGVYLPSSRTSSTNRVASASTGTPVASISPEKRTPLAQSLPRTMISEPARSSSYRSITASTGSSEQKAIKVDHQPRIVPRSTESNESLRSPQSETKPAVHQPFEKDSYGNRRLNGLVPDSLAAMEHKQRELAQSADEEVYQYVVRHQNRSADTAQIKEQMQHFGTRCEPSRCLSPREAVQQYVGSLSPYEMEEIWNFNQIYYVGSNAPFKRPARMDEPKNNYDFDDERSDYRVVYGDHIFYRYEVLSTLGKGSFGEVVKCRDHCTGMFVALKIIRNKRRFHQQALVEVKILDQLARMDPHDQMNILRMTGHFEFRSHLCIVTEMLSLNLYEFIKANSFQGFSVTLIRQFTYQMLKCLSLMSRHRIVHCDLKPENILLIHPFKSGVKVIDFGSSCFENEKIYTYIQSRFYRSPEVILGLEYNMGIDMWSLGCILAELYTGYPLFPGENEQDQFACIMEILGLPDRRFVDGSSRKRIFYDSKGFPRPVVTSKGRRRRPGSKSLDEALRCRHPSFVDFVGRCLAWDPRERMTPDQALQHEFLVGRIRRANGPSIAPHNSEAPHLETNLSNNHEPPPNAGVSYLQRLRFSKAQSQTTAASLASVGTKPFRRSSFGQKLSNGLSTGPSGTYAAAKESGVFSISDAPVESVPPARRYMPTSIPVPVDNAYILPADHGPSSYRRYGPGNSLAASFTGTHHLRASKVPIGSDELTPASTMIPREA